MSPKILLRIAAGLVLFFALGHSVGHFTRKDVSDPQAKQVLQAMSDFKFDLFGTMRSYDENYTGMSLNLILTLLAFTLLLWILSNHSARAAAVTRALLFPILLCLLGFAITGFMYFFLLPAITCLLASAAVGLALTKLKNQPEA